MMQRTQIYLTPAQHEYLTNKSQENSTSISEEIRRIIDSAIHHNQVSYPQKRKATAGHFLLTLADKLSNVAYQVDEVRKPDVDFDQYLLDDYERIKNYYR